MAGAPRQLVPNYLSGCLLAVALGVSPVAVAVGLAWLRGVPLNLAEEYHILLFQVLWTAMPFLLLALFGVRDRLPWLVGIVPTAILWLLLLASAGEHEGANI